MSLPSKTALVTGASSGIGEVYARRLAERGYTPILVARRADRLADVAADIFDQSGVTARIIAADLTSEPGLSLVEEVLRNERIDLLVNNAGMGPIASTADLGDVGSPGTELEFAL